MFLRTPLTPPLLVSLMRSQRPSLPDLAGACTCEDLQLQLPSTDAIFAIASAATTRLPRSPEAPGDHREPLFTVFPATGAATAPYSGEVLFLLFGTKTL